MANKERLKSLRLDFEKSLKDLNRSWTVWKCRYEEEFGTNAYNNEKYSTSWLEGQWYEYSDLDDQLDEIVYSMLVNSISQYSGQMSFSLSTTGGFATSEVPVDATPASVDSAATQDESAVNILTSDDSLMTFEGLGHATPALGDSVVTTDDSTDVMLISNNPLTPVNAPLYKTLVSDDSISTAAGSAQFNFVSEGSPDGTSSGLISMWACSSEAFNWFVSALLRSATDIINSPRHFIPPSDVKLPMVLKPPAVFSSL